MEKIKKLIFILIIIALIVISLIIYIILKNKGQVIYGIDEEGVGVDYNYTKEIKEVSIRNNYYVVETCLNKFYTYYTETSLDQDEDVEIESIRKQALYEMLGKEYIENKGITEENILEILPEINESVVNITDMYVSEQNQNFSIYFVYGNLREKRMGTLSDFKVMIKVDALNKVFNIYPEDYLKSKYPNIKIGDMIDSQNLNIEKGEYNIFEYNIISEEKYVGDLFEKYREEILYNRELAYNHLDKEYREKRFLNLEEFKLYAKNNVKNNVTMKLSKYQVSKEDEYTQYICIDQNGNYYIFHETAPMKYTLILDTYTIDLPEFISKYNEADNDNKVALNINKVNEALNHQDYRYIYNKLDETYKKNNFDTLEKFETFIKNNVFNKNKFENLSTTINGDVYILSVKVTDLENENNSNTLKIFLRLKDSIDFVISFEI